MALAHCMSCSEHIASVNHALCFEAIQLIAVSRKHADPLCLQLHLLTCLFEQ